MSERPEETEFMYNVWVDGIKIYSNPMTFDWATKTATIWRNTGFEQVVVDTDDLPFDRR